MIGRRRTNEVKSIEKGIALGLACILTASLCRMREEIPRAEIQVRRMPCQHRNREARQWRSAGGGETKDAPADIPQPDPDERYSISYTGMWSGADYEDGSYIETMIEDALNVDITVEKAETNDTIDLLLASGRCRTADGSTRR